jgi:hypothetical protein
MGFVRDSLPVGLQVLGRAWGEPTQDRLRLRAGDAAPPPAREHAAVVGATVKHMDLVPDVQQISRLMAQATAPAFVLGAVAGFVSILLGRMTTVVDRIRSLNEIADDDATRAPPQVRYSRLRRRAEPDAP